MSPWLRPRSSTCRRSAGPILRPAAAMILCRGAGGMGTEATAANARFVRRAAWTLALELLGVCDRTRRPFDLTQHGPDVRRRQLRGLPARTHGGRGRARRTWTAGPLERVRRRRRLAARACPSRARLGRARARRRRRSPRGAASSAGTGASRIAVTLLPRRVQPLPCGPPPSCRLPQLLPVGIYARPTAHAGCCARRSSSTTRTSTSLP